MRRNSLILSTLFLFVSLLASAQDEVRVIVGFNGKAQAGTFENHGGKVQASNDTLNFVAGTIPAGRIAQLKHEPNVAYVEEDGVATTLGFSDSPAGANPNTTEITPWGLQDINAAGAWTASDGSYSGGSIRVRVAVCDTGVYASHPDLAGQVDSVTANFTSSRTNSDKEGHGTHVSGTIAAIRGNGKGVIGVAYRAQIVNVKVLGDNGSGYWSWVASGITYAADHNCRVISMSLGGSSGSTGLASAVDYAWGKGCVLCAAAGNDGTTNPGYPAYYTNCIAVAAVDSNNVKASFSTYGSWTDISAPGVGVLSTTITKSGSPTYASWSGTSMATPHVSGTAALVWAKLLQDDLTNSTSTATNAEVRRRIELSANRPDPVPANFMPGVLDANRAVVTGN